MIVAQRMRKPVITTSPSTTLAQAQALMREHSIRHLPVLEGEKLVGIVSSRDIRAAVPLPAALEEARAYAEKLQALPVSDVMAPEVVAVAPFTPVEHCARLMTGVRSTRSAACPWWRAAASRGSSPPQMSWP